MAPFRLSLASVLLAGPALAHPGHLAGAAGHDHWVAGAAIGAAATIALWGYLKGRKAKGAVDHTEVEDSAADEALQEAEA